IEAEAHGNLWSFSLTPEKSLAVSLADMEAFADGVVDARRAWLLAHGAGPMVLYWWHDRQTGRLRFSLVSAAHGRLPFGCEVVLAASFGEIVDEWLGSSHLHGISWAELRPLASGEKAP